MSSSTWTSRRCRPRTPLVLALGLATAAVLCVKTSQAQQLFQGIDQVAETLVQIWPEHRPDIEAKTKEFKENTLEKIRELMDTIVSKTAEKCYCRNIASGEDSSRQFAINLVPRARPDNSESILIMNNSQKQSDISHWKTSLEEKISHYYGRRVEDETIDIKDCSEENPAEVGQVCKFDFQYLGTHCDKFEGFGYDSHSPCIIVEMNKILNWTPDVYTSIEELPADMPSDLKLSITSQNYDYGSVPKMLWLNCKGQTSDDDDYIGRVEYTPWQGFPAYYFPYRGDKGYLSPIVAVRFINPAKNVLINIECKVYAKNIAYSRFDSSGSIVGVMNFELFIE